MLKEIDLRKLAKISSHDRSFLSIYLSHPHSLEEMEKVLDKIRKVLRGKSDDYEHFEENVKMAQNYLKKNPYTEGYLCIFCCWFLDFFEAYKLEMPAGDFVRIDSSPFIRPLAELKDEYENFAVVVADNKSSRIFLVTSGTAEDEEKIRGNVKNHVRVGGWSQQRYERRRDKEMHHYAREITEKLDELDKNNEFRRIILVGSKETIKEIRKAMPAHLLKQLVAEKALDLRKGDDYINKEIFDLFFEDERKSERHLWEKIKGLYLKGELAAIGIEDVLSAAKIGRVDKAIVSRDVYFEGVRCKGCEALSIGNLDECPECGSKQLFEVDMVNEIVELLAASGAVMDFAEGIEELVEVGDIAALLRY